MKGILALLLGVTSLQAHALFIALDVSVTSDPGSGVTDFEMRFNRPLDFATTDELGRHSDWFQFWITDDKDASVGDTVYQGIGSSMVQGVEIDRREVIICTLDPAAEEECGGWGFELATVDPVINGASVSFGVPTRLLGIENPRNPPARWFLETYEFGALQFSPQGATLTGTVRVAPVPEPSGLIAMAAALVALTFTRRRRASTVRS